MRQRLDDTFIDLLSNVRIARSQSSDLTLLQLKTLPTFGGECHDEAVCVFAENAFVNIHIQECWKQQMMKCMSYQQLTF